MVDEIVGEQRIEQCEIAFALNLFGVETDHRLGRFGVAVDHVVPAFPIRESYRDVRRALTFHPSFR